MKGLQISTFVYLGIKFLTTFSNLKSAIFQLRPELDQLDEEI